MYLKENILILKRKFDYIFSLAFKKKSYAQHNEDQILEFVLGDIKKFIDIGANDGLSVSNTFLFALKGAKGLSFEPVKKIFNQLQSLYSFNSKVRCFQVGLSDREGFLEIRQDGLLSSFVETEDIGCKKLLNKFINENATIEKVPIGTLRKYTNLFPEFQEVDFVSLDVEGHELKVLKGIDFDFFQTKCFLIETHGNNESSQWIHKDYQFIDELLSEKKYTAMLINLNNTFWVHENYAALFSKDKLQDYLRQNKIVGYQFIKS